MSLRFRPGLSRCYGFVVVIAIALLASSAIHSQSQARAPVENSSLILLRDAAQAIAAGDLPRAETALNTVLSAAPDDFRALNLLGIVRAQQGRESDAEKLFKRALELKADFASAHVSLGMLYVQMSKPDDAIPQFEEALRIDSARSDALSALVSVLREQARSAVARNDPEKALSCLLQARKLTPKDPSVLYDFGMVALRMALFPDAAAAFTEALEVKKDDSNTLYALGRAQMALANFEGARVEFDRYCQLNPLNASGRYALGMTLSAVERSAEARTQFEKSIELQPAQTESYFQLGRIDLEAGDLSAAETELTRVLQRDPRHAEALAVMGRLKFQQKDYAAAMDLLQKAVALSDSSREAHYYLGMTYARLDRKEDSEKELATASRIEHEEVEKHQNMLKIIDPDQVPASELK
jgi:Flp pilus assembly protein TadD